MKVNRGEKCFRLVADTGLTSDNVNIRLFIAVPPNLPLHCPWEPPGLSMGTGKLSESVKIYFNPP